MIEMTENLNKRFVKDCKLPIQIYKEPYFTSRLKLCNPLYDSVASYELFSREVMEYENEEQYFAVYNNIKENMMSYIKSTDGFNKFNEMIIPHNENNFSNISSKDIYKPTNIGREFISIDMIKANFNTLRHFDPSIFDNELYWEDFVYKFTKLEHIINSKYIREVIFGKCNAEKTISYEKYLMTSVLTKVLKEKELNIVYLSNDEVVIDVTDDGDIKNITDITKLFLKHRITPLRFEVFTLKGIMKDDEIIGYIKESKDGVVVKKVNSLYMPSVLRYLNDDHIEYNDLIFEYEGNICKITEAPKIKIINEV